MKKSFRNKALWIAGVCAVVCLVGGCGAKSERLATSAAETTEAQVEITVAEAESEVQVDETAEQTDEEFVELNKTDMAMKYWTVALPENMSFEEMESEGEYLADFYGTVGGEKIKLYSICLGGELENGTEIGSYVIDGENKAILVTVYELDGQLTGAELDEAYVLAETINDVLEVIVSGENYVDLVLETESETEMEPVVLKDFAMKYWTVSLPENMSFEEAENGDEYLADFYGTVGEKKMKLYSICLGGELEGGSEIGSYTVNGEEKMIQVIGHDLEDQLAGSELDKAYVMAETINDVIGVIVSSDKYSEQQSVVEEEVEPVVRKDFSMKHWKVSLPENMSYEEVQSGDDYQVDFYGMIGGKKVKLYSVKLGDELKNGSVLGSYDLAGEHVPVSVTVYEPKGVLSGEKLDEAYVLMETINDVTRVIVASDDFSEEVVSDAKPFVDGERKNISMKYWTVSLPAVVICEEEQNGDAYQADFYSMFGDVKVKLYSVSVGGELENGVVIGSYVVDGKEMPVSVTSYELKDKLDGEELDEAYTLVETINEVIPVIVESEGFREI